MVCGPGPVEKSTVAGDDLLESAARHAAARTRRTAPDAPCRSSRRCRRSWSIAARLFQASKRLPAPGRSRTAPVRTRPPAARADPMSRAGRSASLIEEGRRRPRFGPDQGAVTVGAGRLPASASRRLEIRCCRVARVVVGVCGIDGCTRRRVTPGTMRRSPSARRAAPRRRQHGDCREQRRPPAPAPAAPAAGEIAEQRQQRRDEHGQQAEAIDPDQRRGLQHRRPAPGSRRPSHSRPGSRESRSGRGRAAIRPAPSRRRPAPAMRPRPARRSSEP